MTLHSEQDLRSTGRSRPGKISRRDFRRAGVLAMCLVMAPVLFAGPAAGQKQKKEKKDDKSSVLDIQTRFPMSDAQAIDLTISQMLGAWQVGDVEHMRKYYVDDLTMVSGAWEPPLFGWTNYVRAYQGQRSRVVGGRLDRTNTVTKVTGDTAWSTYQWEFSGQVDGKRMNALGHTTLVLQKRAGNWVIVMNHTSSVPSNEQSAPASPVTTPQTSTPHALNP
jgi:ketosteroid isomerase-like protein